MHIKLRTRSSNATNTVGSETTRSYLLAVELQQHEHLQRRDVQRPVAELQLGVPEPRPLQPPRLGVAQTVYGLTCRQEVTSVSELEVILIAVGNRGAGVGGGAHCGCRTG